MTIAYHSVSSLSSRQVSLSPFVSPLFFTSLPYSVQMDPDRIPSLSTEEILYYKNQYSIQLSHEQLKIYVDMLSEGFTIQFEYPKVVVIPQIHTVHKAISTLQRSNNILDYGEMMIASKHGMYKLPLDGKYHRYDYLMEKFTGLYSPADACELASVIQQLGEAWQERAK